MKNLYVEKYLKKIQYAISKKDLKTTGEIIDKIYEDGFSDGVSDAEQPRSTVKLKNFRVCPKCGKNDFYTEEITGWSASFDEDGTLDLCHGEAGGTSQLLTCNSCGLEIDTSDSDFEINFN